jgi:FkbM family methyltransferase
MPSQISVVAEVIMVDEKALTTSIPVAMTFPATMSESIQEVLKGEYECGYFGQQLVILDIGANVGSFSLWANLRWPQSTIHAYEPHPETFSLLTSNVEALNNVTCYNAAVSPTEEKRALFFSRYAGDGESGLVTYLEKTFEQFPPEETFTVPVLHPEQLPACDILKIDVEGAEAAILGNIDLSNVSVILLEYQNRENQLRIKALLEADFLLEYEDCFEWDALLPNPRYRSNLRGDIYGHLFFVNKRRNRLRKVKIEPGSMQLRLLLVTLPLAVKDTLRRRMVRLRSRILQRVS